jgi:hypothetical protein
MVITTTDIQFFQILKLKLGAKIAEALVTFVDNKANLRVLSTKENILLLNADIAKIERKISKLKSWVFGFFIALMLAIVGLYFKT